MANGNGGTGFFASLLDPKFILPFATSVGMIIGEWFVMGNDIARLQMDVTFYRNVSDVLAGRLNAVERQEAVDMNRIDNLRDAVSDLQRR